MTRCLSCKAKYRIRLQTTYHIDESMEQRKRAFFRQLATQTCGTFVGVQAVIIGLGMLIREIDSDEKLVRVFGFPQDPGQNQPGNFRNALYHHKCTYYSAGLIAFLAIVGFVALIYFVAQCCCYPSSRSPVITLRHNGPRRKIR